MTLDSIADANIGDDTTNAAGGTALLDEEIGIASAASVTTLDLTLDGVGAQTSLNALNDLDLDVLGTGVTTVALTATGVNNISLANTGAAMTALTVGGAGTLAVQGALANTVVTVDASKNTGGVTATAGTGAVKFTGGTGNDSFDTAGNYTTADVLDGGAGTADNLTIDITEADPTAVQTNVTNFEKLTVNSATAAADEIDTAKFVGVTSLELSEDSANAITVTGMKSGQTITLGTAVDDMDLDVNLSDAAGAGDSINVVINDATAADGAADIDLDLTGIETVTIDASTSTATDVSAIDITNAQLGTLNLLAGANTLNLSGTDLGTVVTKVDAGGTTKAGGININLSGTAVQGVEVIGTKNVDTINGSSQADNITGGNGADVIAGLDGIDTIVLTETTAAIDTVSLNEILLSANRDVITGFKAGTGGDEIEIGAAETDFANADTNAVGIGEIGAKSNTHTLADTDLIEFSFDVGSSADLSAAIDGTELLKGIAANGSATVSVNTDGDALYIIAYDAGNAYLYHADESAGDADAALAAGDISLVATIETVGVGTLTAANFDLVA